MPRLLKVLTPPQWMFLLCAVVDAIMLGYDVGLDRTMWASVWWVILVTHVILLLKVTRDALVDFAAICVAHALGKLPPEDE